MASVLDLELSEHHVCSLIDLFQVHGEADLRRMLCNESLTILPQLLEGLALTLGLRLASFAFGACSLLNEGLEAELNSNSHKVRVLCCLSNQVVPFHDFKQRQLLFNIELNTPRFLDPSYWLHCSLIELDKCAAKGQQFVLERLCQVDSLRLFWDL